MARTKRPIWLRIIIWVTSTILSFVAMLALAFGFIYIRYDINVITVAKQIKILNEPVDIQKIAPNSFTIDDMKSAKDVCDANVPGLISYSETDGYSITTDKVSSNITNSFMFSDKQIGAILGNVIDSQEKIMVQLGANINLKDYGFKVIQVDLSNITSNSSDFNVVVKIDLHKAKETMTKFPLNWISKGIPDYLYLSSTVKVTKTENKMEYTTEGVGIKINNLTLEQSENILRTINIFVKMGSSKEFSKTLTDTFVNIILGNSEAPGICYAMTTIGVNDFVFESNSGVDYLKLNV